MKKIRTSAVAALTAGTMALTATPAMAQGSSALGSSNLSSDIGTALGANESERAVWGSSKESVEESAATPFTWLWYGYTIATTAALIGTTSSNVYPAIQDAAANIGVQLPNL